MHVFLETGSRLKITQTEHGLFVSFDRAVVEEYVFGEHGPVNVGPVVAERASGWEGDVYVIETADRKGHKLVEHYWLEDDGQTLVRKIALWKRNERELFIEQAFDRD